MVESDEKPETDFAWLIFSASTRNTCARFLLLFLFFIACLFQRAAELAEHIVVSSLCDVNGLFSRLFAEPSTQFSGSSGHRSAFSFYRHSILSPTLRDRHRLAEVIRDIGPADENSID